MEGVQMETANKVTQCMKLDHLAMNQIKARCEED